MPPDSLGAQAIEAFTLNLTDLVEGRNEWMNIQGVVRLALRELAQRINAQGDSLRGMDSVLDTMDQSLVAKPSLLDVERVAAELHKQGQALHHVRENFERELLSKVGHDDVAHYGHTVSKVQQLLEGSIGQLSEKLDADHLSLKALLEASTDQYDKQLYGFSSELTDLRRTVLQDTLPDVTCRMDQLQGAMDRKAESNSVDEMLQNLMDQLRSLEKALSQKATITETSQKMANLEDRIAEKANASQVETLLHRLNTAITQTEETLRQHIWKNDQSLNSALEQTRQAVKSGEDSHIFMRQEMTVMADRLTKLESKVSGEVLAHGARMQEELRLEREERVKLQSKVEEMTRVQEMQVQLQVQQQHKFESYQDATKASLQQTAQLANQSEAELQKLIDIRFREAREEANRAAEELKRGLETCTAHADALVEQEQGQRTEAARQQAQELKQLSESQRFYTQEMATISRSLQEQVRAMDDMVQQSMNVRGNELSSGLRGLETELAGTMEAMEAELRAAMQMLVPRSEYVTDSAAWQKNLQQQMAVLQESIENCRRTTDGTLQEMASIHGSSRDIRDMLASEIGKVMSLHTEDVKRMSVWHDEHERELRKHNEQIREICVRLYRRANDTISLSRNEI
ncbi:hypothetical protein CYMTET_44219 [Cymbomonas tetramitiformis]|uniref:Uncharacterized protein n=1 Tax=Cymbomonas tetramitiformis TaxID=36881 RepID=A0AAE0C0P1_9CHLO|nr:hypothetical protein CYMTET_44219 [Cymbomonas tetramitiformis]